MRHDPCNFNVDCVQSPGISTPACKEQLRSNSLASYAGVGTTIGRTRITERDTVKTFYEGIVYVPSI